MISRALRVLSRLFERPPPATAAQREAVKELLPDATAEDVERVAIAARDGDPRRLQTELVEAGVKLSAAPATAHMLRSRFARFLAVLVATVERAMHEVALLMPQLG